MKREKSHGTRLFDAIRTRFGRHDREQDREVEEDLLKAVYELGGRIAADEVQRVGESLGVDADRTAAAVGRLALRGELTMGDELQLTDVGREHALRIVRAHRIYAQYLAQHSGYAPAEWHERAHHMEHRLDARERERMASLLGNPLFDPHGDPIPTAGLTLPALPAGARDTAAEGLPEAGTLLRVVHIEDDDARRFARIAATGLAKDAVVRVAAGAEGTFAFDYEGEHFALPAADLAAIDLRPLTPAEAAEVPADAFRMSRLAEGQTAVVAGLSPSCRGALRRRLMDLGFVRGSRVSVGMRSPLGNPVAYVVRGTAIALRREQARQIIVTPL